MTRLLLMRHARSTWNAEGRIQGHADPPLDETGKEQARSLAERLREESLALLYTSCLRRALNTAEIVKGYVEAPLVADQRLNEQDVGHIAGLTWNEALEEYPSVARQLKEHPKDIEFPGGESNAAFRARVVEIFSEIASQHQGETVGVVSHGGTLGVYMNHLIGFPHRLSPFHFANGSISIVELNSTRPRILLANDTCHLEEGDT